MQAEHLFSMTVEEGMFAAPDKGSRASITAFAARLAGTKSTSPGGSTPESAKQGLAVMPANNIAPAIMQTPMMKTYMYT